MKSKAFVTFYLIILGNLIFGQTKFSELNPDFIDYLQGNYQGKNYGALPPPILVPYQKLDGLSKTAALPIRYDLRDSNFVTSVKSQGICGSCWTFSTMATLETRWLRKGYGEFDLSENNLKNGDLTEIGGCNGGGNALIATMYFNRGDGPVLETEDPYFEGDDPWIKLPINYYVPEARFLPAQSGYPESEIEQYISMVKTSILKNGAHATYYFHDDNYLEWIDSTLTYYYPGGGTSNHSVTIIGWNDTITTGAPQKGAWLIKNSWGSQWGMEGYFYISYYDKLVNLQIAYWPEREEWDNTRYIYDYDKIGGHRFYGEDTKTTAYGLIKADLWNQNVSHISTWSIGNGANLYVEIYDDFTNDRLNGLLATGSRTNIKNHGYYSVPLDSLLNIQGKNDIFIKVTYENNPADSSVNLPVETTILNFIIPEISEGNDWISFDGINWDDSLDSEIDLCIKVHGHYTGLQANFEVSKNNSSPGDTIRFTDLTIGLESPLSWRWNFGDGTTSTEQSPFHVYDSAGIFDVSLEVSSENFSEIITQEKAVIVNPAKLLKPAKNSREYVSRPNFNWDKMTFGKAYTYTLKVAEDKNFQKKVKIFYPDTMNNFTPEEDLEDNQQYYWTISARENISEYFYNDTNDFIINIEDEAPTAFNNKVPKNGAIGIQTKVGFLWEESEDADPFDFVLYKIKVGHSPDSLGTVLSADSLENYYYIMEKELEDNTQYFWQVTAFDNLGLSTSTTIDSFVVGSITAIENSMVPRDYQLSQNYPNPFNPATTIEYALKNPGFVKMAIYNSLGKKVYNLVEKYQPSGIYRVQWNAKNFPSGIYFYKITCKSADSNIKFEKTRKMMLIK
jgi:C1A family cysteine protease